jgi:hypothetical protein
MAHPFASQAETLRNKLLHSTDLSEPWSCFHEELASSPTFLRMGVPEDYPLLWNIVAAAAAQVLGEPKLQVSGQVLVHLPELHLWHGAGLLGSHPVAVVHLDDIDKGLAGLLSSSNSLRVELMRFSVCRVPDSAAVVPGIGQA